MAELIRETVFPSEILVSENELGARLGRKVSLEDAEIKTILDELYKVANPVFVATRVNILGNKEGIVTFEGFLVESSALSRYFEGSCETFLFMATLGTEVDRLIAKKRVRSLSDGFIYDAVASAVIEAVCDAAEKKICGSVITKNRFSPGYADCPLSVQKEIVKLLSADKYAGIKLLDSLLMSPMKSVSAFIAIRGK